jgi:DNA polymerase III epsilon subunit-like protein
MNACIVAIDTETTSLRPDRRAWEIGLIERVPVTVKHPDGPDTYETEDREHVWLIDEEDLDLANADLFSLKIGRFYERHPQMQTPRENRGVRGEAAAMEEVEHLTRGAHLIGAVVNFDADVLSARMRAHGICPSWHYHLICVENLAVGALAASAALGKSPAGSVAEEIRELITPPWKSDDLSAALGVTVSEEDRHTALGDARFAMRVYDAVMGGKP